MNDHLKLRRHRTACPFYREHWFNSGEIADPRLRAEMLYDAYCLKDMPPQTLEEQHRCMRSRHRCWRQLPQFRPRDAGGLATAPAPSSS